jgi:hypothetical protein
MAENLVTVAASLGISSITCLIFWFCSMFPGALEGKRILAVRHDKWQPGEKKNIQYMLRIGALWPQLDYDVTIWS